MAIPISPGMQQTRGAVGMHTCPFDQYEIKQ